MGILDDLHADLDAAGMPRKKNLRALKSRAAWHDTLKVDRGKLQKCMTNVLAILTHDDRWKGRVRWDEFGESVLVRDPPWSGDERPSLELAPTRPWTDEDDARLAIWLHRTYDTDFHLGDVTRAVSGAAQANSYHPVREYLRGLVWDGTPRLDALFVSYFGAEDTAYHRAVGAKWMIAAVARVMVPGCKVDCVPILEGAQGIGKSTGLAALAGEWFCDTPIAVGDREAYQTIRGRWIVELSELDSLSRAEVSATKAFLSAQADHYRAPYARRAQTVPRQCVFAGTTNEETYLKDATGNRRFWPVRCGRIDRDALARDRAQLWAEARVRLEGGERWHIEDASALSEAAEVAADRVQEDPLIGAVKRWLDLPIVSHGTDGITTERVLVECLKVETSRITRTDEIRIGAVLRRLGLERRRVMIDGDRSYRYFRRSNAGDASPSNEVSHSVGHTESHDNTAQSMSTPSALSIYRDKGEEIEREQGGAIEVVRAWGTVGQRQFSAPAAPSELFADWLEGLDEPGPSDVGGG